MHTHPYSELEEFSLNNFTGGGDDFIRAEKQAVIRLIAQQTSGMQLTFPSSTNLAFASHEGEARSDVRRVESARNPRGPRA